MRAGFAAIDDGFVLRIAGQVRLAHQPGRPALACGKGEPNIIMVRGNFDITDQAVWHDDWSVAVLSADHVTLTSSAAGSDLCVTLRLTHQAERVDLQMSVNDPSINRVKLMLIADADEHVWGGGEQMSYLSLKGRRFPIWTSEPGVGRDKSRELTQLMDRLGMAGGDYWTTNYPQPTFLSSMGYAVHIDSTAYSVLDFTNSRQHSLEVWSGDARFEFYSGDEPADLVSALSKRFGRQPRLPDWAISGAIIGLKDGSNSFARLDAIRAAGVPVGGLWCEDWVGVRETSFGRRLFWDWQWSNQRYPDLPDQIATLKADGISFLGYVNPYLAVDGPQFNVARDHGYLALQLERDEPYLVDFGEFDCGVVDFTNQAACDWFGEVIIGQNMLDFGIDGWMADLASICQLICA